ncbi:ABC-three component system protein [Mycoplasma procyoni]|uniref:ABC-three component system protein n=1 Tax=Mycoplasma procyoni TaxID=568784 RepID=UPI00197C6974|nr:ABC-three component system protein [Mycoplasma procyoni]MBN3534703.1 SMEK domain-containing protein [Mycoplasma procyoni]
MEELLKELNLSFSILDSLIKINNQNSFFDLNKRCENLFRDILNQIFDWKLINANEITKNNSSFDLIDDQNKILIQVSSKIKTDKIKNSLEKSILKNYQGYKFIFLFLTSDSNKIKKDFSNEVPEGIIFDSKNIWNFATLIEKLLSLKETKIETIQKVCFLLEWEITILEPLQKKSILAQLIFSLSSGKINDPEPFDLKKFKIEQKIDFNQLQKYKDQIKEFSVYFKTIENLYSKKDKEKPGSQIAAISKIVNSYRVYSNQNLSSDEVYSKIFEKLKNYLLNKKEISFIDDEMFEFCLRAIITHSFIKCNIFKKPEEEVK